jgi:hypothetical protein
MRMPARSAFSGFATVVGRFSPRARGAAGVLTLVALAGAAHADMPKVLDRISPETPLVAVIDSIDAMEQAGGQAEGGPDILEQLPTDLRDMLAIESLDKGQSIALLVWPKEKAADEAKKPNAEDEMPGMMGGASPLQGMAFDAVLLVPQTDYAGFVKGLKAGEAEGGVSTFTFSVPRTEMDENGDEKEIIEQETMFVKDAGNGYAALGRDKAFLASYKPAEGQMASQVAFLGDVGKTIEARTQLMLITNVSKVKDGVAKTMKQMEDGASAQMAMMGQGEGAEKAFGMMNMLVANWSRDARVAILGQGASEKGVSIEIGTEFAKDSELGKMFGGESKATDALAHVPDVPFMFALGFDASSAAAKALVDGMAQMQGEEGVPGMGNMMRGAKDAESFALLMGAPPAGAMGGLFTQTVSYIKTSDPAKMLASAKTMTEEMNNKVIEGTTYKTKYRTGVKELAGVKVDSWEMAMEMDPNDENAQMAQMMQGMIMGAGPMKGFYGATENAVVSTLAANEPLMAMALDTAKSGKGLGTNELVQMVRGQLPEGSNLEAYIGVKPLGDMALGLASMMMGPMEVEIPENMPPVGFGASLGKSGVHASVFLPAEVLKAAEEITKQMDAAGQGEFGEELGNDEPMQGNDEEGAAPKF